MLLRTPQVHHPLRLAFPMVGKKAPIIVVLMPNAKRMRVQAPAVGRCPAPVVLCPASNRQVPMGHTNGTGCTHAFYDPDVHRNRPLASTPFSAFNQQSLRDSDRKLTGGANGVGGGQGEIFRTGSRSSCLQEN
jgi:hypothetical protein